MDEMVLGIKSAWMWSVSSELSLSYSHAVVDELCTTDSANIDATARPHGCEDDDDMQCSLVITGGAFMSHLANSKGEEVDCRTQVIEFRDDEATDYAILSHRRIGKDNDVRQRDGYGKILASCEQAKRDGYEWLWTIDKRSSAELSEAINSMYRWYANSGVCYVYLHDVAGTSLPTEEDKSTYPSHNGWPEWFSRGWTLQQMIAPDNQSIGDKRTLTETLSEITRVPQCILKNGLSSNRPCVAQIMSWAANRTTTRLEDKAYSLLGLLDASMPMLYGEGKKAFHRLQLEIIHVSNDQSIFAWRGNNRTGSVLADEPSFFEDCSNMELMDPTELIRSLNQHIARAQLPPIDEDRLGTFPITNRGIQIWMLLRPLNDSDSVFEAWLPCRDGPPSGPPVRITLALWNSNHYRYGTPQWEYPTKRTLQFRQVYLRYQDLPHCDITFTVEDSTITEGSFTYRGGYPKELTGDTLTLSSANPLCVRVYSGDQDDCRSAVGIGKYFDHCWIQVVCEEPTGPEHAQSTTEALSGGMHWIQGELFIRHTCIPGSKTSPGTYGVMIEVFRYRYNGSDEWTTLNVLGTDGPNRDMRGLMIPYSPRKLQSFYMKHKNGVSMTFFPAPDGIKVGDYGYFTDSDDFCCEGNIFSISLPFNYMEASGLFDPVTLHEPPGLSLPSNHVVNSLLAFLSTRLANKYIVVTVIGPTRSSVLVHPPISYPAFKV
ncbi:hypothetical protein V8B97DRAFT_2025488 [Scleroderma yunnanense]